MPNVKADLPAETNTELDSEIDSETDVEWDAAIIPNAGASDLPNSAVTFAYVNPEFTQEALQQNIEDEKTAPRPD